MKGCQTKDDFNAAIEFGKAINAIHPDQTQEVTLQFLKNTRNNVSKISGKYSAGTASIKESVTEKIGRLKPYTGKPNLLLEQQGNIGNHIHEVSGFMLENLSPYLFSPFNLGLFNLCPIASKKAFKAKNFSLFHQHSIKVSL